MRGGPSCLCWPAICCALLALSGCRAGIDPALYAKFQAAQEQFDRASQPSEFLRAAALYQEILDSGVDSGAVLYNQGNAFMQAGHRGRAIACYRQAQRYRPRDPQLEANLRYALDGGRTEPPRALLAQLLFWQSWLSYPEKFHLSTAAACLTFGLGVVSLFVQRGWLRSVAAAALLLTCVLVLSAAYDWYRFDYCGHGVIVVPEVVARKGNAVSYEPAFTQPLKEGTEFRVLESRGGWLLVRLDGGQEGWVPLHAATVF